MCSIMGGGDEGCGQGGSCASSSSAVFSSVVEEIVVIASMLLVGTGKVFMNTAEFESFALKGSRRTYLCNRLLTGPMSRNWICKNRIVDGILETLCNF